VLLNVLVLDGEMSVSAALARLARNGLWLDPKQTDAKAWIETSATRLGWSFDEIAQRIARDPRRAGVAIRRQWYASVLWYPRLAVDILRACVSAQPNDVLHIALGLREEDSRAPIVISRSEHIPARVGVVFNADIPVGVNLIEPSIAEGARDLPFESPAVGALSTSRGAADRAATEPIDVRAWPRIDAPDYTPAGQVFNVIVGLQASRQLRLIAGQFAIQVPAGTTTVAIGVELIADGVDAIDGWTHQMLVDVQNPTAAQVTFQLRGRALSGELAHLTMLEVRYVFNGTVCGSASRPLVIGDKSAPALDLPTNFGTQWLGQASTASPLTMQRSYQAADLTIELVKPNGNRANGRYVCRLQTPHPIGIDAGPHDVDLGDDAKTFAKSIVDQVRQFAHGRKASVCRLRCPAEGGSAHSAADASGVACQCRALRPVGARTHARADRRQSSSISRRTNLDGALGQGRSGLVCRAGCQGGQTRGATSGQRHGGCHGGDGRHV
jgi:Ternary complex associated domain 7